MRIGIDIRPLMTWPKTGVGEYTFNLLENIFHLDQKNEYFLFYNSVKTNEEVKIENFGWIYDNVHFVHTAWPNKLLNASIICTGRPYLDRLNNDKLDIFFSPNLNFTNISSRTKFVLTVHDLSFELFPEFFTKRQRLWHQLIKPKKQCERADIILVPSENTQRDLVDYYHLKPEKIKVIYPGLSKIFTNPDEEKINQTKIAIRKKYALPDNFILFLGAIEPRKNIIGLVKAYEKSFSRLSLPYSLVIAGADGWKNKDIYKTINLSPLKNNIKIIGYIAEEEKPALYSLADLFIYPSFYEGFGLPVLEALSMKIPVITSNRSSLPEITGNQAMLINPHRPQEMAEAIQYSLKNKKSPATGESSLKEKFSWQKSAEAWLKLL